MPTRLIACRERKVRVAATGAVAFWAAACSFGSPGLRVDKEKSMISTNHIFCYTGICMFVPKC